MRAYRSAATAARAVATLVVRGDYKRFLTRGLATVVAAPLALLSQRAVSWFL
ncbi:MAG: hypothetical protein AB7O68_18685 [Pirellulales bacterium]